MDYLVFYELLKIVCFSMGCGIQWGRVAGVFGWVCGFRVWFRGKNLGWICGRVYVSDLFQIMGSSRFVSGNFYWKVVVGIWFDIILQLTRRAIVFCVKTKKKSLKNWQKKEMKKWIETEQGRQRDGAKSVKENTCFDVSVRRCGRWETEHGDSFSLEK